MAQMQCFVVIWGRNRIVAHYLFRPRLGEHDGRTCCSAEELVEIITQAGGRARGTRVALAWATEWNRVAVGWRTDFTDSA
jgi:hypothetical protein